MRRSHFVSNSVLYIAAHGFDNDEVIHDRAIIMQPPEIVGTILDYTAQFFITALI